MLPSFTWHQFLMLSMIFTAIWYSGMILFFYRNKWLNRWMPSKTGQPTKEPLPHKWDQEVEVLTPEESPVGKASQPDGLSTLSAADFRFAPPQEDRELQQSTIPDVLEELKDIFTWLQKEDGTKQDFFHRWNELKAAFPKILASERKLEIQNFIIEHAPFFLNQEELERIWY